MENTFSEHRLVRSNSLCLPSHGSPTQGDPENASVQLSHKTPSLARDALILGPSAALNRNPTPIISVKNTPLAVSQLSVSEQSTVPQPSCLASRSKQFQEQGFSV